VQPDPQPWWRNLTLWAFCLAGLAAVLAAVSIMSSFRLSIQWGAVAEWVGAFGSILAAVVALGIAIHSNTRQIQKENEEQQKGEARARRRASRVTLERIWQRPLEETPNELEISIKNTGQTDLYEMQWFCPAVVYISEGKVVSIETSTDTTITDKKYPLADHLPETIVPGQRRALYVPATLRDGEGTVGDRAPRIFALVTYVDADGYRLGRVYERDEAGTRLRNDWAVVDDNYPPSITALRGVLDSLTAEPPQG
jgi:hypothetical protein